MNRTSAILLVGLGLLLTPAAGAAEETPAIKRVPPSPACLQTLDGKALYQELCVACHGVSGLGDGAAAEILNPPPPDLTRLATIHGGRFPALRVRHAISGQHRGVLGSEMPEWEGILGADTGNAAAARLRVYNLLQYVKEIQVADLEDRR